MTRAERRAIQARIAVGVWAMQAAKRAIKNQLRAQGLKLWDFTGREITIRAEALLKERPEFMTEAWEKARAMGYLGPSVSVGVGVGLAGLRLAHLHSRLSINHLLRFAYCCQETNRAIVTAAEKRTSVGS
jgi:hypothetical protein